jgi:hypothetical protein
VSPAEETQADAGAAPAPAERLQLPAYRVLITGSRDFPQPELVRHELTRLWLLHEGPFVVAHGACPTGPDDDAYRWVTDMIEAEMGVVSDDPMPADWDHCTDHCRPGHRVTKKPGDIHHPGLLDDYCPAAGPRRNGEVVARGADRCLAFISPCTNRRCHKPQPHGSHGATGCADLAEKAGIPTRRWTA